MRRVSTCFTVHVHILTHLVHPELTRLPHSGYISPEAMETAFLVLTRLESLVIKFESSRCLPESTVPDLVPVSLRDDAAGNGRAKASVQRYCDWGPVICRTQSRTNTIVRQGNLPSRSIQSNVHYSLKLSIIQIHTDHGVLELIPRLP